MGKKLFAGLAAAALIALMAASAQAAEKAAEDKAAADAAKLGLPVVSYYPLAPEIVTNYTIGNNSTLCHQLERFTIILSSKNTILDESIHSNTHSLYSRTWSVFE